LFRVRHASVFEDTRAEPFVDKSQKHSVNYPSLEKGTEMVVVDRIEEFSNVDVHDPATPHLRRLLPQGF
jgi:hypothetical protein